MHQWGSYYTKVAQSVRAGTWQTKPVWGGMKDGFITLAPFAADVPKETVALIEAKRRAIVDGSLKPFSGRLVDNEGKLRLASGELDDPAILQMNWFVQGVVGQLPRP